ncbi:hypothetical protein [Actinoplanes sp. L3-i22]|uniref:hypothetical protein n=1 Tax=Actinoplanes sp. L3-i22 TaxID=2836373 RepID=UPI001C75FF48|nr:hypothetical protein [Actinoplanes sp. L3-i22]BCY07895.1 hypothetical protein L3i22_029830 [Actinoplanes sp. L3-i22]
MTLYFDLPRTTALPADPSPWRNYEPSPRLVHAAVGSGLLAVLVLAAGIWSLILRDPAAALACGVAVLVLGHLFGLLLNLWVHPQNTGDRMRIAGIDDGSPGLTFAYSGRLYYWYAGFLTLLTLAQIALALDTPVLAAGAVLTGGALLVVLRHAPGRLAITPDGVYHHGVWAQQFIPWEAVADIVAGEHAHIPIIAVPAVPSPETRTRRSLFRAPEQMTIQVPWLATDPALILQAMRWYHANPSHRFELSYHIAVDRTRQRAWHLH